MQQWNGSLVPLGKGMIGGKIKNTWVSASWKVFWTTECSCEPKMLVGTMLPLCPVYKQLHSSIRHCSMIAASYPGLFTLADVACSTNARKGRVKLITCDDVPGCWVDMWRSGRFLMCSCEAAFWTQETSPRLPSVKHSVVPWSVFVIYSTVAVILGMWYSSTRPSNIQVVIAHDQFY